MVTFLNVPPSAGPPNPKALISWPVAAVRVAGSAAQYTLPSRLSNTVAVMEEELDVALASVSFG